MGKIKGSKRKAGKMIEFHRKCKRTKQFQNNSSKVYNAFPWILQPPCEWHMRLEFSWWVVHMHCSHVCLLCACVTAPSGYRGSWGMRDNLVRANHFCFSGSGVSFRVLCIYLPNRKALCWFRYDPLRLGCLLVCLLGDIVNGLWRHWR